VGKSRPPAIHSFASLTNRRSENRPRSYCGVLRHPPGFQNVRTSKRTNLGQSIVSSFRNERIGYIILIKHLFTPLCPIMEQAIIRALYSALIDQACHVHACLCDCAWYQLPPSEIKDTLDEFVARLLKVNARLISASDIVQSVFCRLEESDKSFRDLCLLCNWATLELQSMLVLLKPLYALSNSWMDDRGIRETARSKDHHRALVVTGNGFKTQEIDPFKFGGRKILVDVIDVYEASITRILSRIQEVAENQGDISSL
jgi:predicted rRNA methylase YqxC with S4 and FtsJ domains